MRSTKLIPGEMYQCQKAYLAFNDFKVHYGAVAVVLYNRTDDPYDEYTKTTDADDEYVLVMITNPNESAQLVRSRYVRFQNAPHEEYPVWKLVSRAQ